MYEVRNEAERAEILIYDEIGERTTWYGEKVGISAERFKESLDEVSPKPVDLHIDSSGGDVFEAFAMCSAIQRYKGEVHAYVDGLAASAASYIAVVCDEVTMNDYAYLMIHCASAYKWGNARDMEDIAERLRNIDANLARIYAKRSALTIDEVIEYMREETWFTADKALEVGLCTEVLETEERIAACVDDELAKHYRHVPENMQRRAEALPGIIDPTVIMPARARGAGTTADDSHAANSITDARQYSVLDGLIIERKKA